MPVEKIGLECTHIIVPCCMRCGGCIFFDKQGEWTDIKRQHRHLN